MTSSDKNADPFVVVACPSGADRASKSMGSSTKVEPSIDSGDHVPEVGLRDGASRCDVRDKRGSTDNQAVFSSGVLGVRFSEPGLETLYLEYVRTIRHGSANGVLVILSIFDVYAIATALVNFDRSELTELIVLGSSLLLCITLLILSRFKAVSNFVKSVLPYLCWCLFLTTLCLDIWLNSVLTLPNENLAWQVLLNYAIFVMVPLSIGRRLILFSLSSIALLGVVVGVPTSQNYGDAFALGQMVSYCMHHVHPSVYLNISHAPLVNFSDVTHAGWLGR